jgi:hypothetical protein
MLGLHLCPRQYDNKGSYVTLPRFSMCPLLRKDVSNYKKLRAEIKAYVLLHTFLDLLYLPITKPVYVIIFVYKIKDFHRHHNSNCWITNKILYLVFLCLTILKLKPKDDFLMPSVQLLRILQNVTSVQLVCSQHVSLGIIYVF